jgi:hypothetical protein
LTCRFVESRYLKHYQGARREKAVLCVQSSKPDICRDVPPGKLLEAFRHPVFRNEERSRIEMQLHAVMGTVIRVVGKPLIEWTDPREYFSAHAAVRMGNEG